MKTPLDKQAIIACLVAYGTNVGLGKMGEISSLYRDLKAYKAKPEADRKAALSKDFDRVFTMRTSSAALNDLIIRERSRRAAFS